MEDMRRLSDICWIARRLKDRALGSRIEEFVSLMAQDYVKAASKEAAKPLPAKFYTKEVASNEKAAKATRKRRQRKD